METQEFNIWMLVAGLGVFLYSMYLLEESIKELGGDLLRNFIKKVTNGRFLSIGSGTLVTGIIQSSSAVSLMVLAFAGAGLMDLTAAIGVIIGSNLGTTTTSWIIATLGFKFSIESISLPIVGIGGLGMAFIKKRRKLGKLSSLVFSFGLLLLGLGFMKEATDVLAGEIDLTSWDDYRLLFLLGGILLAALMQSSSAAVLIAFSGLYSGIFDWNSATYIVIGTALGTTITVYLGSLTGVTLQKRIAASHFFFNLVTVILAVALMPFYTIIILDWMGMSGDLVIGLAIFHTMFKLVGAILFGLFLGPFTLFIKWVVKERKPTHTRYISNITSEVAEAGITAMKNEVMLFQNIALYFVLKAFNLSVTQGVIPGFTNRYRLEEFKRMDQKEKYEYLKDLHAEIYNFSYKIRSKDIKTEEDRIVSQQLNAVRNFMMAVKKCKDLLHDIQKIRNSPMESIREVHIDMAKILAHIARDINSLIDHEGQKEYLLEEIKKLDQRADNFTNTAIDQINKGTENQSIPAREQSSLLTIHNEFHQVFIFFLEGLKHLFQIDEEKMENNLMADLNTGTQKVK